MESQSAEAKSQRDLVDRIYLSYEKYDPIQCALIPILQDVQAKIGYLPGPVIKKVAELLNLPPSQVYGVATFYHQFRLQPKGEHMITVCRGTACHVQGSLDVYNYLNRQLGIASPQDTSQDGIFTVQQVRCLGACGLAPIIKIDNTVYGRADRVKINRILQSVKRSSEAK